MYLCQSFATKGNDNMILVIDYSPTVVDKAERHEKTDITQKSLTIVWNINEQRPFPNGRPCFDRLFF